MKMRVEDEYTGVLQNIETGIAAVFDKNPKIVDRDVLSDVDALIKAYTHQESAYRSIRFWHAQAGPQGYLTYVRQFLGDSAAPTALESRFRRT